MSAVLKFTVKVQALPTVPPKEEDIVLKTGGVVSPIVSVELFVVIVVYESVNVHSTVRLSLLVKFPLLRLTVVCPLIVAPFLNHLYVQVGVKPLPTVPVAFTLRFWELLAGLGLIVQELIEGLLCIVIVELFTQLEALFVIFEARQLRVHVWELETLDKLTTLAFVLFA